MDSGYTVVHGAMGFYPMPCSQAPGLTRSTNLRSYDFEDAMQVSKWLNERAVGYPVSPQSMLELREVYDDVH